MRLRGLRLVFAVAVFVATALYVPASHADPVTWATWITATLGNNGIARGNIGGISVTYTGQIFDFQNGYPQWLPASSYIGGDVSNAPPLGNLVGIEGGTTQTETITFSKPVVNPVLAIWSLGDANTLAEFVFNPQEPFSIIAGGPSIQFGGGPIYTGGTCPAYGVCGEEANGVIQFDGTFTSITWTNPLFEGYYVFEPGVLGDPTPTPEPSSLALLGIGLLVVGGASKRLLRFRGSTSTT